ncbi:10 transmembrane domain, possible aa transporter, putative, partial [Perkinsus marinus ATCC 50983]
MDVRGTDDNCEKIIDDVSSSSATPVDRPSSEMERHGTILSGWSVMANSMIGTGVLGLASAFAKTGWLLGFVLMSGAGFLALFSLHLMVLLSMKFVDRDVTYYTVAAAYAPWSRWIVDVTIVVKCFGVAVSYLQVAGDVLSTLFIHWSSTTMSPFLLRAFVIGASGLLMAPICTAKEVKNTLITNVLAVVTIGYCVVLGIAYADVHAGDDSIGIPQESSITSVLAKLPIFIFAFTCHQNMFITRNHLKHRTQRRLDIIIVAAESTAALLYIPAVIFPYLTYGSAAQANFMLNIDLGHVP